MIDFYVGPSRTPPFRLEDRVAPTGTRVARPFDIRHGWRVPLNRSTGGEYYLTNHTTQEWVYTVGVDSLYRSFMALYNPVHPWVWIQSHDPRINAIAWYEACMMEPKVARLGGFVIQNLVILFVHVTRYLNGAE